MNSNTVVHCSDDDTDPHHPLRLFPLASFLCPLLFRIHHNFLFDIHHNLLDILHIHHLADIHHGHHNLLDNLHIHHLVDIHHGLENHHNLLDILHNLPGTLCHKYLLDIHSHQSVLVPSCHGNHHHHHLGHPNPLFLLCLTILQCGIYKL